jgi:hypothetical protein
MNSCLYHCNKEKLTMFFPKGGGLEGSDLRQCLPEPSEAVFVFKENNDGSGGHHAHLVRSKQDGVGTLPMLRVAGGDVLSVEINL